MAKKLVILFLVALPLSIKAQQITLIDTNCRWSVLTVFMGFIVETHYLKFDGDTLIDSSFYKKIISSPDSNFSVKTYEGAAWEVPAEMRVYLMRAGGHCNPPDILCDFSLMQGDTTETYFCAPMKFRVDSVDSIPVDGQMRKRYILNPNDYLPGAEEIIEGIGSTFSLIYPQSNFCITDLEYHLLCVQKNGGVIYTNPNFGACHIVGTPENVPIKPVLHFYPNPVSRIAIFEFNCDKNGRLEIMDNLGRMVRSYDVYSDSRLEFDCSGLKAGLFFYRYISEDGKQLADGKMIIE